jgi:hypothetical protein
MASLVVRASGMFQRKSSGKSSSANPDTNTNTHISTNKTLSSHQGALSLGELGRHGAGNSGTGTGTGTGAAPVRGTGILPPRYMTSLKNPRSSKKLTTTTKSPPMKRLLSGIERDLERKTQGKVMVDWSVAQSDENENDIENDTLLFNCFEDEDINKNSSHKLRKNLQISQQNSMQDEEHCPIGKSIRRLEVLMRGGNDDEGAYYSGEWNGIERSGQGTMIYADGSKYVGGWVNSMRHGKGIITYPNGDMYDGMWREGVQHGLGMFKSAVTLLQYEGHWCDGKINGRGKLRFASGEVYEGEWQLGQMHGEGRFTGIIPSTTGSSDESGNIDVSQSRVENSGKGSFVFSGLSICCHQTSSYSLNYYYYYYYYYFCIRWKI